MKSHLKEIEKLVQAYHPLFSFAEARSGHGKPRAAAYQYTDHRQYRHAVEAV